MPAHLSIVPASTSAGRETIRLLLESPANPVVRGFYRDPAKAPPEFLANPRFQARKGDVATGSGLDFSDSNAVFYIPPPTYDGTPLEEWASKTASNVKTAIQKAPAVQRLVLHSALGAQFDHDIGVLALNHITDEALQSVVPEVTIIRPALYYQMWADAVKTMQSDTLHLESSVHPEDWQIPMLSVYDIAKWVAQRLLADAPQPKLQIHKFFGPRLVSPLDIKSAIESITGKQGRLTTVPAEEQAQYWAKHVPEAHVAEFIDYQIAQLPGGILVQEYGYDESTLRGERELVEDLRLLANK